MSTACEYAARRAWREPMLWLVWGLPAAVVLAGFGTLAIAVRAGGADAVAADVRRTAQVQVEDFAADRAAAQRGLHGRVALDRATGALRVTLAGRFDARQPHLQLMLQHPTRAAADVQLSLVRQGDSWFGRVPGSARHAWWLTLQPEHAGWRLAGRLDAGADAADLRPRVEG